MRPTLSIPLNRFEPGEIICAALKRRSLDTTIEELPVKTSVTTVEYTFQLPEQHTLRPTLKVRFSQQANGEPIGHVLVGAYTSTIAEALVAGAFALALAQPFDQIPKKYTVRSLTASSDPNLAKHDTTLNGILKYTHRLRQELASLTEQKEVAVRMLTSPPQGIECLGLDTLAHYLCKEKISTKP